jgi:quinoprotein glucose dehydrogenase
VKASCKQLTLAAGAALLLACGSGSSKEEAQTAAATASTTTAGWPVYGGDAAGTRYSPLTEIRRENVERLTVAWTLHTGDFADRSGSKKTSTTFEATPILVDGTLYFPTPFGRVFAVDPESGEVRWRFDTKLDLSVNYSEPTSRGVAAWSDPAREGEAACGRRIFYATPDARLFALDARTGEPCQDFGVEGRVDLKRDVGDPEPWEYVVSSPPAVIHDLVVVGSGIADNQRTTAPRGVVRAFDARTGVLRWSFDPIPRDPADPAFLTWERESARRTGAANAWSILSVDAERDLVFAPTSSPSPDYYGGERLGENHWADSVVALRGSTGTVAWAFQTVHHDLWDYDVPAQPVLANVRREGRDIPAVVQATKTGFLFVLQRDTGEPLFPVREQPVPASDVPGEQASPTQPVPTLPLPLVPQGLRPEDAFGFTWWDRARCRDKIAALRSEGVYTPPSLKGTILFPGIAGGTNWGSLAIDPEHRLALVNTTRLAFQARLIPREQFEQERAQAQGKPNLEFAPQAGTPYGLVRGPLLSPFGVPCNAPPWGALSAVDLNTGEIRWQVSLGTTRDLLPIPISRALGTPNLGGPMVTASGLVFIGAAMDNYLRAFDLETGAELWKGRLPAGGQATPMTYRLRPDGRQYVVIAAGGHGRLGTKLGDALVAFALPKP